MSEDDLGPVDDLVAMLITLASEQLLGACRLALRDPNNAAAAYQLAFDVLQDARQKPFLPYDAETGRLVDPQTGDPI